MIINIVTLDRTLRADPSFVSFFLFLFSSIPSVGDPILDSLGTPKQSVFTYLLVEQPLLHLEFSLY